MQKIDIPLDKIIQAGDAERAKHERIATQSKLARQLQHLFPERQDFSFIVVTQVCTVVCCGYYEIEPNEDGEPLPTVSIQDEITFHLEDSIVLQLK